MSDGQRITAKFVPAAVWLAAELVIIAKPEYGLVTVPNACRKFIWSNWGRMRITQFS